MRVLSTDQQTLKRIQCRESYAGPVVRQRPHGYGVLRWRKGNYVRFEGEFKAGDMRHGTLYFGPNGKSKYKGALRQCRAEGMGELMPDEADDNVLEYFHGGWHNGLKTGWGTARYRNGDVYEGTWQDNKMCGTGTYTWSDGTVFAGQFQDDEMHGDGECCWSSGIRVRLVFTHCYPNHVRSAVRLLCALLLLCTLLYVMPHLVDMTAPAATPTPGGGVATGVAGEVFGGLEGHQGGAQGGEGPAFAHRLLHQQAGPGGLAQPDAMLSSDNGARCDYIVREAPQLSAQVYELAQWPWSWLWPWSEHQLDARAQARHEALILAMGGLRGVHVDGMWGFADAGNTNANSPTGCLESHLQRGDALLDVLERDPHHAHHRLQRPHKALQASDAGGDTGPEDLLLAGAGDELHDWLWMVDDEYPDDRRRHDGHRHGAGGPQGRRTTPGGGGQLAAAADDLPLLYVRAWDNTLPSTTTFNGVEMRVVHFDPATFLDDGSDAFVIDRLPALPPPAHGQGAGGVEAGGSADTTGTSHAVNATHVPASAATDEGTSEVAVTDRGVASRRTGPPERHAAASRRHGAARPRGQEDSVAGAEPASATGGATPSSRHDRRDGATADRSSGEGVRVSSADAESVHGSDRPGRGDHRSDPLAAHGHGHGPPHAPAAPFNDGGVFGAEDGVGGDDSQGSTIVTVLTLYLRLHLTRQLHYLRLGMLALFTLTGDLEDALSAMVWPLLCVVTQLCAGRRCMCSRKMDLPLFWLALSAASAAVGLLCAFVVVIIPEALAEVIRLSCTNGVVAVPVDHGVDA